MTTFWEGSLEDDLLLAEMLNENEVSRECMFSIERSDFELIYLIKSQGWEAKETYITSLKTLMSDLDHFMQALSRHTSIDSSGLPLFHTDAPIESSTSGIFDAGCFTDDTLWLDPQAFFVSTGWPPTDRCSHQIQSGSVNRKRKSSPAEIRLHPSSTQACVKRSRKTAPSQSHETIHKLSTEDFERQSANSGSWLFNDANTTISSLSDMPPLVTATDLIPPASLIELPAPSSSPLAKSSSKSAEKIPQPLNCFMLFRIDWCRDIHTKDDWRSHGESLSGTIILAAAVGVCEDLAW
jgi:hypothetical protein